MLLLLSLCSNSLDGKKVLDKEYFSNQKYIEFKIDTDMTGNNPAGIHEKQIDCMPLSYKTKTRNPPW